MSPRAADTSALRAQLTTVCSKSHAPIAHSPAMKCPLCIDRELSVTIGTERSRLHIENLELHRQLALVACRASHAVQSSPAGWYCDDRACPRFRTLVESDSERVERKRRERLALGLPPQVEDFDRLLRVLGVVERTAAEATASNEIARWRHPLAVVRDLLSEFLPAREVA